MSNQDRIKAMTWFEFLASNVEKGHSMEEFRAGFRELKATAEIDVMAMSFNDFREACNGKLKKGEKLSMTDLSVGFHEMKGTETKKAKKAKGAAAPQPVAEEVEEEVDEVEYDLQKLNRKHHALQAKVNSLEKQLKSLAIAPVSAAAAMPAGAAKPKRAPTEYNQFVSTYSKERKEKLSEMKIGERSAFIAAKWKEQKGKAAEKPAEEKKHDDA